MNKNYFGCCTYVPISPPLRAACRQHTGLLSSDIKKTAAANSDLDSNSLSSLSLLHHVITQKSEAKSYPVVSGHILPPLKYLCAAQHAAEEQAADFKKI